MKDGGAAFPRFVPDGHYGGSVDVEGMSLRDWFAGQAIAGILANSEAIHAGSEPTNLVLYGENGERFAAQMAGMAYRAADAMLAERTRPEFPVKPDPQALLVKACEAAAEQFDTYAQHHDAKGTEDGAAKAERNRVMATQLRRAIAQAAGRKP